MSETIFEVAFYKELLKDWMTAKQIQSHYELIEKEFSKRKFSRIKNKINLLWSEGKCDYFIAHSTKLGYKATCDINEIKISLYDMKKRCKSMGKYIRYIEDGIATRDNIQLKINDE